RRGLRAVARAEHLRRDRLPQRDYGIRVADSGHRDGHLLEQPARRSLLAQRSERGDAAHHLACLSLPDPLPVARGLAGPPRGVDVNRGFRGRNYDLARRARAGRLPRLWMIEDRGSRIAPLSIFNLQSSILDPRSSILDPRPSIINLMGIVLIGTSHKTAPVEVRERLAFAESRLADALRELVDREMINEGLIVSTCNRVELIAATPNGAGQPDSAVSRLNDFLIRFHQCDQSL